MEEISVNGEIYTKASVLAKNFGYTSDYVGQLCRSGQVKATLVGRSWYVNEDSMREHRKGRYRSSAAKSKDHLRQEIENRVVKSGSIPAKTHAIKSRYESDESDLFPILKKPAAENEPVVSVVEEKVAENKDKIEDERLPIRQEGQVRIHRSPAPVLRTIPRSAYTNTRPAPSKTIVQPRNTVREPVPSPVRTNRTSMVAALALVLGILAIESTLLFGMLGLEKRVLVNADNQAMVLYAFDATKAIEPLKQALSNL